MKVKLYPWPSLSSLSCINATETFREHVQSETDGSRRRENKGGKKKERKKEKKRSHDREH